MADGRLYAWGYLDGKVITFSALREDADSWDRIKLRFDVAGLCKSDNSYVSWTEDALIQLPKGESPAGEFSLDASVDEHCTEMRVAVVRPRLISATGGGRTFTGKDVPADLRIPVYDLASKDARRRTAIANAEIRQIEVRNAAATQRRTARKAACSAVYSATSNKKIGDLTVKESDQIQSCRAAGMYGE